MLKVIPVLVALSITAAFAEEYHEGAAHEFENETMTSATYVLPSYIFANKKVPQVFKVTREAENAISFQAEPSKTPFALRTIHGSLKLSWFRFSFNDVGGTRVTLRFEWKSTPKKVLITSRIFTAPTTPDLLKHAQRHAVTLNPMEMEDIDNLLDQKNDKIKQITLSPRWIAYLLTKRSPRYKPISNNTKAVWVFAGPPSIMDADLLKKLEELQKTMKFTE